MNGLVFEYFAAQRRTEQGTAEIVSVNEAPTSIFARILPPVTIKYRFTAGNETITSSRAYDIAPQGSTVFVVYEPTKPKNNSLMLPSRKQRVIFLIAIALFVGGGWLIYRNFEGHKQRS
jgi:hypothetical protein